MTNAHRYGLNLRNLGTSELKFYTGEGVWLLLQNVKEFQ